MHRAAEQKKNTKRKSQGWGKFNPWSHDKNKSISFSLRRKSKSLPITTKICHKNNINKRHFSRGFFFFFCISSFLNTGIIYSTTPHPYRSPLRSSASRSVGPAAGLGGPPLARSAVSVHEAVLTLVHSTVQNILNVLYYQVDGHCRRQEQFRHNPQWGCLIELEKWAMSSKSTVTANRRVD